MGILLESTMECGGIVVQALRLCLIRTSQKNIAILGNADPFCTCYHLPSAFCHPTTSGHRQPSFAQLLSSTDKESKLKVAGLGVLYPAWRVFFCPTELIK